MRQVWFWIAIIVPSFALYAQNEFSKDTLELEETVVTGFQPDNPQRTSLNIEPVSLSALNQSAPLNLSDALTQIPGVSQLTTGNSISKPVVRGLYGNRVLVLLSGLRFDNQQWQDEHGLGLSQIGIDRVEIIKGPASLLYGSDALGGVINIIEEVPTISGSKLDINTTLQSNTEGGIVHLGYSHKNHKNWWRLRGGYENHADYSDGNGDRVLNSRNKGYYLKAGYGFQKGNWKQNNSYNFSYNQYGFIINDLRDFFEPDERWSRDMSGPHHNVMLNLLNSQNTFFFEKSTLKVNGGFQSNIRQEDEGGGQISLNMHLLSLLENLKWEKSLTEKIRFVTNQQFTYSNNTNYGGRILVPDADMYENNLSAYLKFLLGDVILETGLGATQKTIKTYETRNLNSPGEPIQPFENNYLTSNYMLGLAYNLSRQLTIKLNSSTGFRAPNLAELSSNGLHEGIYRYEIGDPDMAVEQNLNTDLNLEYRSKQLFLSASGYYNKFFNYIYLRPTEEEFYGFDVYRYHQYDATIIGGEASARWMPAFVNGFSISETYVHTRGTLTDGRNLPFIPANQLITKLRYETNNQGKMKNFFIQPEFEYHFAQEHPSEYETSTPEYFLVNLSAGTTLPEKKGDWKLVLNVKNLTNEAYANHLSRLKPLGMLNQGINFVLSVKKELLW